MTTISVSLITQLEIESRLPRSMTLEYLLAIPVISPSNSWALDFANPDFSGLAPLMFEDI